MLKHFNWLNSAPRGTRVAFGLPAPGACITRPNRARETLVNAEREG
jgi:hypothetical protein